MSNQDPIADMITRIRNSQMAMKKTVTMPSSNIKEGIAKVLQDEGYISGYKIAENGPKKELEIELKYYKGKPVICKIKRVSKTSLRIYKPISEITAVPGFGIAILTTSKGVISHLQARQLGIGGEVLVEVA